MLRGASVRLLHNPLPAQIAAQLDQLVVLGCQAVSIVVSHYCSLTPNTPAVCAPPHAFGLPYWIYPDVGQDPVHPFQNTSHPALVELTCRLAKARGLQIMIKAHVDSNQASWRGYLSVKDIYQQPARWDVTDDWGYAYVERFLRGYAAMADCTGAALCLGCELVGITRELQAAWWIAVAHGVRGWGFTGPLTYAANWGSETMALEPLWADPAITAIGVDWYVPAAQQDAEQAALLALQQRVGKPLWLTEIGYSNAAGPIAAAEPWHDPVPGDLPDNAQQAALIAAARARWEPHAAVSYWWEAAIDPALAAEPVSHQLLGRPAGTAAWAPLEGVTL